MGPNLSWVMICLGRQTSTFQQVTGLLVFYFFMAEVMTDMGIDVPEPSVGSLDLGFFVLSLVTLYH